MVINTSQTDVSLPEPNSHQTFAIVSALEAGIIHLPLQRFVQGSGPNEVSICPSLAFSISHKPSGAHLVFDTGLRRDVLSYPPAVQESIKQRGFPIQVPQSVDESLRKGGIAPEDVKTVILSHIHFDHIGDASAFPNATFILGPGARGKLEAGYPHNPNAGILHNTVPFERTRFLSDTDFTTSVGPFPRAYDYFGDGSLYIIDAPGHCAGHINILARTSGDGAWIYLAGDTAHDVRILTSERGVAYSIDDGGHVHCAHDDKEKAEEHICRVQALLAMPRVQVLLAHDKNWYEENRGSNAFLPGFIQPLSC